MWPFALALAALVVPAGTLGTLPSSAAALLGSWTCAGPVPGSASEELFTAGPGATLRLENTVRTGAGARGVVEETYAYDRARGRWTLTAPANRFFDAVRLTAAEPANGRWLFTGTQTLGSVVAPVRVAYRWFGSGTFRREHYGLSSGAWKADGAFVCHRAGESQVAGAVQRSLSWNVPFFAASSSSRSSSK